MLLKPLLAQVIFIGNTASFELKRKDYSNDTIEVSYSLPKETLEWTTFKFSKNALSS